MGAIHGLSSMDNLLDPLTVMPAMAGIQTSCASFNIQKHWIPAFAGMTTVVCHHWSDCISLDFALGWHALIPEDVVEITSVTTRRTCQYDTTIGRFSYTHLSADWYGIGVRMLQNPEGLSFLIASPEKALVRDMR